jgi:alpha-glucan phosphorylase-like protein
LALFADMHRLKKILFNKTTPLQIIISGKAAGTDSENLSLVHKVRAAALDPMFKGRIAFLPDHSIDVAEQLVRGGDVWLNTPIRGVEACGTSGMKAGLNGTLMASVSDGWMDEVNWRDIGWILSDDQADLATSLYEALERHILPEFYSHHHGDVPQSWISRMRATMHIVESGFSTARMLKEYEEKLYKDD